MNIREKKLIIFDLDGTLAISKGKADDQIMSLLKQLSDVIPVSIISGGRYQQFEKQIIPFFPPDTVKTNIFLFPTSGAAFFRYDNDDWKNVYAERLEPEQIKKIFAAFPVALEKAGIVIDESELHGPQLEDRDTQVSWSALGQECPIEFKEKWDPDRKKRLRILPFLQEALSEFDVRVGGSTTIDVTRKGIDKKYGIKKMNEYLGVAYAEMLFIGDAIFPGGNDYACVEMGIDHIATSGVEETKRIIGNLLATSQQS